jgi:hypothetical protein
MLAVGHAAFRLISSTACKRVCEAAESLGVSLAPDTGSATKSFPWPSWRQCGTIHVLYVLSHGYGYLEEHA